MDDERKMRRALELAERGWGLTSPNPMVGCVLVSADETATFDGWHEGPGTPHAEVMALAEAGADAAAATLFTTLEPCDHFGRTGPCTQAIIDAGVSTVVVGAIDPNPVVDGRGIAKLRAAGIEVRTGVLEHEAERQLEAYARHVTTGLPFVTLKMAASLDGRTAADDGSSTWITGEEARARVQRLRAGADAVMIGSGTALTDDPRLTVRDPDYEGRAPLRVVVDSRGRVPAEGNLFDGSAPTLIATTEAAPGQRRSEWASAGAEVLIVDAGADGRASLPELMRALGKRDVQSVLLEGGATLAGAAVASGVVNKCVFFFAPRLIGGDAAPGILGDAGVHSLAEAVELDVAYVRNVGPDLEVEAYVHRDS